ncbi:hypothetical protein BLNAU_23946 [Blattamonas nauphoetae]|uniref:Uncharacterized protein n=1 Tax=Blattamonas nauphoetae TaxID=2049346 RepID=A0ABQ9WPR4_9EUKA|nr:hypothetical protein BLNAU_23946 [Blattamonas nauphoetae]
MATLTLSLASWQAQFHSGELQESTAVRDCRKSQKFPFYLKPKAGAMDISLPLTMSIHCAAARSQQIEINSIRKFNPTHFDSVGGRSSNFGRIIFGLDDVSMTLSSSTVHSVTQTADG